VVPPTTAVTTTTTVAPTRAVEGDDALVGRGLAHALVRVEVDLLAGHQALARLAHVHRLVLDDGVQPRHHGLAPQARRAPDEDLQRALVGVVRVVEAQRVAPRGAQQRRRVARHRLDDERVVARRAVVRVEVPHLDRELRQVPAPQSICVALGDITHDFAPSGARKGRNLR